MWLVVHLTFLTGFRNRFAAMLHWSDHLLLRRPGRADDHAPPDGRPPGIEDAGGDGLHPATSSPEQDPGPTRKEHP